MTYEIRAGDICVLPFPFSNLNSDKKRPALALSEPDQYGDIRFACITAQPGQFDLSIEIEAQDYAEGQPALPRAAYIRLEKQYWLNRDVVLRKSTALSGYKLEQVLRQNVTKEIYPFGKQKFSPQAFVPGTTAVPVSGKVLTTQDVIAITESAMDAWLTTGRFNQAFEKRFAEFVGVPYALTTNSGSSANLLALAALTSPKLADKALKPGDEVVTVAAGFPTTVNPIVQMGLKPVFVDITLPSYNIDAEKIEQALSPRTRAIMLAHTLGNPFDLEPIMALVQKYDLWLIEDCCDALGSTYKGQHVGTFGHIASCSFYPAHHITMGEGGMVFTQSRKLKKIIESFRDWGRDCYCAPGCDDSCGMRYGWQLGDLPKGYDHKYTYSHLGYNLKITDMQAAVGLAQLERLPRFIEDRKRNFQYLKAGLSHLQSFMLLPEATAQADPSWFGFPITLSPGVRNEFIAFLQQKKIDSRLLFAGNLTRQPYFAGKPYRLGSDLKMTDRVMHDTLWLGCFPGLNLAMLDYMIESISEFFLRNK